MSEEEKEKNLEKVISDFYACITELKFIEYFLTMKLVHIRHDKKVGDEYGKEK